MGRSITRQLLTTHGDVVVRQPEIHTDEPPVSDPSAFEVEMANEMPNYRKTNSNSCWTNTFHIRINSVWNKQWKELIPVPIHEAGDNKKRETVMTYQLHTEFYQHANATVN